MNLEKAVNSRYYERFIEKTYAEVLEIQQAIFFKKAINFFYEALALWFTNIFNISEIETFKVQINSIWYVWRDKRFHFALLRSQIRYNNSPAFVRWENFNILVLQ